MSIEYVELLEKEKAEYPSYRKARERMQELMKAQEKRRNAFLQTTGANRNSSRPDKTKSPRIRSQSVLGKNPRWPFLVYIAAVLRDEPILT